MIELHYKKELIEENEMLKELVFKYKGTMKIPLCEICGELIDSKKNRIVINFQDRINGYSNYVIQHVHLKCWQDILETFKFSIKGSKKR